MLTVVVVVSMVESVKSYFWTHDLKDLDPDYKDLDLDCDII